MNKVVVVVVVVVQTVTFNDVQDVLVFLFNVLLRLGLIGRLSRLLLAKLITEV